jgi:hypothetical protein
MRRYYIVSGILLILPIIDFALAAPVLVQENRQAGVDVVHISEDAITILGKRGNELDEVWLKYLNHFENHFAKLEEPSAARPSSSSPPSGPDRAWTDFERPLPSIPAAPSPVSSPDRALPNAGSSTESGHELIKWDDSPGPSSPASSTMSDADFELVGAHAPPNPWPSTEFDHEVTGVHTPLSSPVFPTWFLTDHGFMGPHAPQPNLGPDSDHRLVVEEPPSRPASPTEFDADHGYQEVHPPPPSPGSASSTNSGRRSMGAESQLENLQAVSDALKGNAKESRRISGTARDVLNAAQRELQPERSLNPGE